MNRMLRHSPPELEKPSLEVGGRAGPTGRNLVRTWRMAMATLLLVATYR